MLIKTGGARLPHLKSTAKSETKEFPLPQRLIVSMSQSMGAPCEPMVKKGDKVTVGMKIGESDKYISAPVHAPASGIVSDITEIRLLGGGVCKAVIIDTDGENTLSESVTPPTVTDRQSFISAVRESGCCGLGGAGFPTHVKLAYDPVKTPVDTLLINGAECEPYITSDHRELMENGSDVLEGARLVMKSLDIPKCLICIEKNKPDAIRKMKELTAGDESVSVFALPSLYPQGAEKVMIYTALGRIVKENSLPVNEGVLVMNVSTAGFVYRYMRTGMPLISRRLTFDGDADIRNRGNYRVPIGTSLSDILGFMEAKDYNRVIFGGPMMGISPLEEAQSVIKQNNALLALKKVYEPKTSPCIRCGRCIEACPVGLDPQSLEKAYDRRDIAELKRLRAGLCINCGCCTYVCPADRRLAEKNCLAKALLRKET